MFLKRNIVIIGLSLLLVFAIAVWLIGIGINKTAVQMHNSMIEEMGGYRAELIAMDFGKTVELNRIIQDYLMVNPDNERELQSLLLGLVRLDAKVSRIWYQKENRNFVCIDSLGVTKQDPVLEINLEKIAYEATNMDKSTFYYSDGILYWTLFRQFQDVVYGIDLSLPDLHTYFAQTNPAVRSYIYILNGQGILMCHPDETRIGRYLANSDDPGRYDEAIRENKFVRCSGMSQFLLLPVERIYFPVGVGNEKWVVVINIPDFITQEEMGEFRRYTWWIGLFTVLVFSVLLAYAQYRWKKEYHRRLELEKETLQLTLQQLKNQINPHFLFNALNSLNALISTEPVLAKEFVLNLSKLYRYVLEKRNDNLVPVREEVEFIRYYFFLQKIRFRNELELDIASNIEQEIKTIPVMSLQVLIENAIKHNEITKEHPLCIRVYRKGDLLIVENDYQPRLDTDKESFGVGFENIRKIYAYCSNKQFAYSVENGHFICILPLI